MKLLVSAYACCPNRGSEPGLGWNWVKGLSEHCEIHVITCEWARPMITEELQRRPQSSLKFHFIPEFKRSSAWPMGLGWLAYYLWQWRAYRLSITLHCKEHFDLVQHLTYVSWRAPSLLWKLGVPFIWGPIGGGQRVPPGFRSVLGLRGAVFELWRSTCQTVSRHDPFIRSTMDRAAVILCANTATIQFLPARHRQKVRLMVDIGLHPVTRGRPVTRRENPVPLRLLWVGRIIPWKALPLLVRALALVGDKTPVHLTVIGSGSQEPFCKRLAQKLELGDRIRFLGQLSYSETQKHYQISDVFVFTSLRDTNGTVVLEAMGAGLPSVVLDCGGAKDIVDEHSAIKIPVRSPDQVVRQLASVIRRLAKDPGLRHGLGEAARSRVESQFSWHRKTTEMTRIYDNILHHMRQ